MSLLRKQDEGWKGNLGHWRRDSDTDGDFGVVPLYSWNAINNIVHDGDYIFKNKLNMKTIKILKNPIPTICLNGQLKLVFHIIATLTKLLFLSV